MIQNFRKKPVVVPAVQLKGSYESIYEVHCFVYGEPDNKSSRSAEDAWEVYADKILKEGMRLKTLESHNETQIASIDDFIIKGVEGEFYPCNPDIFEKTYELVTP